MVLRNLKKTFTRHELVKTYKYFLNKMAVNFRKGEDGKRPFKIKFDFNETEIDWDSYFSPCPFIYLFIYLFIYFLVIPLRKKINLKEEVS